MSRFDYSFYRGVGHTRWTAFALARPLTMYLGGILVGLILGWVLT